MSKIGWYETDDVVFGDIDADLITAESVVASVGVAGATGQFGTLQIGETAGNGLSVADDGTLRLTGLGTSYEDLRIDGTSARLGVVAPTVETGFRGDANHQAVNFVHNQADEVQFNVQLPHAWNEGSTIYPHVHFAPWATNAGAAAVRFVLEYYVANVDGTFPASPGTIQLTKTWTGSAQWKHQIASNDNGVDMTGLTLSSVLKCRLYRDNTVTNNLADKVTFLYFDIHYEVNAFGSDTEYGKA